MERMRRFAWVLALVLLVGILPAMDVSAAQTDVIWINPDAADNVVEINVCANTTVTNGVITLNYDSDVLTFVDLTVESDYVAAHAVNANEAGVVKISWVAPADYDQDGMVHILLQVNFEGSSAESVVLSGTVYTPEEEMVGIAVLDFTQLNDSIEETSQLNADDYTADSYQAMVDALAEAEAVYANKLATQEELDAAAKKLSDAIAALVPAPTEEPTEEPTEAPTEESTEAPTEEPTEAPTEAPTEEPTEEPTEVPTEEPTTVPTEAPTEAPTEVPTEPEEDATQPTTDDSGDKTPGTGDEFPIGVIIILMAVCAVGIVVVAVIIKKKGE